MEDERERERKEVGRTRRRRPPVENRGIIALFVSFSPPSRFSLSLSLSLSPRFIYPSRPVIAETLTGVPDVPSSIGGRLMDVKCARAGSTLRAGVRTGRARMRSRDRSSTFSLPRLPAALVQHSESERERKSLKRAREVERDFRY